MGSEDTPRDTVVDKRWDGREDDRQTYDYIFDQAYRMIGTETFMETGKLLFIIINAWERNGRAIPITVLSQALSVSLDFDDSEMTVV